MNEEKTKPASPSQGGDKFTKQSFWELVRFVLIAIAIVIPIRMFIAQPFIVSGSSMDPTFEDGQYLIIDEISYRLNNPQRNDVVVFRYPNDPTKFFIKRIIGLPNETVDIKGTVITITNKENPEGFILDQSYIKNAVESNTHLELKNDEYFVMGDNRSASSDSRYWGAVPKNLLIGKVFLRLLPISEIGILPGDYKKTE
ncbi:MAG: signal peptidase I [Candidatus Paceibacterota bacterium]|jgi:signal peptidase I